MMAAWLMAAKPNLLKEILHLTFCLMGRIIYLLANVLFVKRHYMSRNLP